ncbi:MAG: aminotransferase class IV family protein [Bacteroidota bacterium]
MSLLFETLRIENGSIAHAQYHEQRMMRSLHALYGLTEPWSLLQLIPIPVEFQKGIFRCRITFDSEIRSVEFTPFIRRTINSLQIVHADNIKYEHKYSDRSVIDACFAQRGSADDILIIRNGFVTDTSFSNVIFQEGNTWYTPETYLLRGTARERLLSEKIIESRVIREEDILKYSHVSLINVLNEPGELVIPVSSIHF